MNKDAATGGQRRDDAEAREGGAGDDGADMEEGAPLSVRNARRVRNDRWPHIWMSFTSIILLMAALVILAYRIGAHGCQGQ